MIWGNYLPKFLSPWNLDDEPFDWQRVHRYAGWIAALSGGALMVVWLAFPLELARTTSTVLIIAFVVLGVGRKLISVAAYSRRPPRPRPSRATSDTAASE